MEKYDAVHFIQMTSSDDSRNIFNLHDNAILDVYVNYMRDQGKLDQDWNIIVPFIFVLWLLQLNRGLF